MSNKQKSIGTNALLNGLKTILSVIFPLITYPYAARVLQVENMGKVDFANSIVSYFVLFAGLGIAVYAIREGARIRDNQIEFEKFSSEIFSINFISTLVSLIALGGIIFAVPKLHSYAQLIVVQSCVIVGNLVGVMWVYSIVEDYVYITIRSLIVHVIALVLMFLFVHDQSDYVLYAATNVLANVGANIFNFFHVKKYVKIHLIRKVNLRQHIKPIMIIFASAVTTTIYVNSDKTILGFLTNEYYVGLYATSVNVYTVLKSCISAIILVAMPRLSNYLAMEKKKDYESTANRIFKISMLFLLPVVIGIFVTADAVIQFIGGSSYAEATTSLKILSLALVFSMIATYYTNAVLLPMKKEAIVLKGTVLSAIINVALNFILLETFKQNGAALTTLLAEIVMCGYQYFYARKMLRIELSLRYMISIIIGCTGIVLVSELCNMLINLFMLNLIVKIVLSVIVYGLSILLLKNEVIFEMLSKIVKNKIRR